jgi:polysaccharide biosynthesis/export protein
VLDAPEFSRQYRISPTGKLVLPMLETPITAAGLKVQELGGAVAKALRDNGLVTNPYVTVSIVSSRMQSVSITGAVKMPQIYPLFGRTTLLELLSQAQGLSEDAGNVAVISRSDVGFAATAQKARTESVDLTKLMQSGDPELNPAIYPGDRVTVPRAGIVYVVGAVNKPGGFTIKQSTQGMTVLQALAFAGDAKATAKRNKTVIIRPDPQAAGGHQQVPLDLAKILSGKNDDPILKPNDVLFIPDSEGKKALVKGLESALNAASMAVVYHPF